MKENFDIKILIERIKFSNDHQAALKLQDIVGCNFKVI